MVLRLADSSKANSAMLFSWIKMVMFTKPQKRVKQEEKYTGFVGTMTEIKTTNVMPKLQLMEFTSLNSM